MSDEPKEPNGPLVTTPVPFQININPEDINRAISDAVLNSAMGKHIKEAAEKAVSEMNTRSGAYGNYDTPIQQIAKQLVREEIQRQMQEGFTETIREKVKAAMTDQLTDEVIKTMVAKLWSDRS